ncbi:MAG: triose-phosphate isomerase [Hyphomonas sp.]|uniref:triose-phosphate isomerase n=1 Tax=Hyphomonas sp. TaxID=87 RepID=UPI00184A9244|nr:triose-phosphate isomerase [Hyphomonas sp.]MBA3069686.1 triose-phosphate isomerase [Hyphomonas sp.]MBU3920183.1 triose-phosphate isomerase [Alphaproteobacteria bacterium]MBU4062527.1 triose-phosphate isomerase [Alphaproteobacteria bacterium]MBU4163878.1 triose-phosphate isomerase [Alphaproteobacteria bacterium]
MNRKLIAGNWKMNGLRADLQTVGDVAAAVSGAAAAPETLLCVPATLLSQAALAAEGSALRIGGQTCHSQQKGAFTGDISAPMLKEAGAAYVIVGHSERRTFHGETDEIVAAQAQSAIGSGLVPIVCVGETPEERSSGQTLTVVAEQLKGSLAGLEPATAFVLAYEPLWAIGTGKVATTAQIAEVHDFVRQFLIGRFGEPGQSVRILYGGSLNPGNAVEILPVSNVDGGLIGGASLKAADFLAIYNTACALQG